MKKAILLIILAVESISLYSQIDENRNFIYFFNDSVLYARNVDRITPFIGDSYLMADTIRVSSFNVKFYKSETGFYANAIRISFNTSASTFSQRVRKGNVNLFEREINHYGGYAGPGMYYTSMPTKTTKSYYNKGYGDLKKANYKNLLIDLSDNPRSMMHLDKYKKTGHKQLIFSVAGGAAIIGGIALLASASGSDNNNSPDAKTKPNMVPGILTFTAGAGCMWAGYFIGLTKPRHLRSAIDAYNEEVPNAAGM